MYNYATCPRSSMDRVPDFESDGWGFESLRGYFLCFLLVVTHQKKRFAKSSPYTEYLTCKLSTVFSSLI